jgi:hypothetical protein
MTKKQSIQVHGPDPNAKPSPQKYIAGSNYENFNLILANQAIQSLWIGSRDEDDRQKLAEGCLEALAGIAPRDEIEGMLAAQMVACHSAAMDCYRRAALPDQTFHGRQQNLNFAGKLSRTFALHMEALDKHRGKGQQKVVVEHVHVHQGGQAIVGAIQGVGASANSEDRAHAKAITDAREPEMRSALAPEREALPLTGDEER